MKPRPYRQKPTPEKHCEQCGRRLERKRFDSGRLEDLGVFSRRKFCGQSCMAKAFKGRTRVEKPKDPARVGRYRARAATDPTECEKCGATKTLDVHHRDGDPTNNAPENLAVLCRSCHTKTHRYRTCSLPNCTARHKGHGYCDKHYQRWKKWGDPRAVKTNQHTPLSRAD